MSKKRGAVHLLTNRFDTVIRVAASITDANGQRVFTDQDLLDLAQHLQNLIFGNNGIIPQFGCGFGHLEVCHTLTFQAIVELFRLGDLAKLFDWMTNPSGPRTVRDKIEQGMGTIFVADNLRSRGWQYDGLSLCSQSQCRTDYTQSEGDWWAAKLVGRTQDGKLVSIVVRGDHCVQCGTNQKVVEIFEWVQQAINMGFGTYGLVDGNRYLPATGVINVVFTHAGAQGVTSVVDLLKAFFNNKDVLIIVSWLDKNGHVYYTCIGKQCRDGSFPPPDQQQIACNDQGEAANCNATEYTGQHLDEDDAELGAIEFDPIVHIHPKLEF